MPLAWMAAGFSVNEEANRATHKQQLMAAAVKVQQFVSKEKCLC